MISFISRIIADFLFKKGAISEEHKEICAYGYEVVLFNLFNALLIVVLGILFHRLVDSMIFFFIFAVLRQYTGGYHAKNTIMCTAVYLVSYTFIMFVSQSIYLGEYYTMPLCILLNAAFVGFIFMYAPVENKNKEYEISEKKKFKKISIILGLLVSVISIIAYYINIRVSAVVTITLCAIAVMMLVGAYRGKEEGYHEEGAEYDG